MRFLLALVFSVFISANAMAAFSVNDWKDQLQSQVDELQTQSSSVKASGKVIVEGNATIFRATLPSLIITSPDRSTWNIPSIILQASGATGAMTIQLPSAVTRNDASKKEIARLTIGQQELNARWNSTNHTFESLNGVIRNLSFNDTIANAKSTIGNISIAANKGAPVSFIATDIRNATIQNQKTFSSTIAKATVTYQIPDANQITIARLIGYINPSILLAENQEVVLSLNAEQLMFTGDNHTTSLQRMTTKLDARPSGQTVSGNINTKAYIVTQSPASPYSFVLPRQMELNANFTDLPADMVSLAPGMSMKMARQAMDQAGTVFDISKLNLVTYENGKVNGSGRLKADNQTPSGFAGRITLKIENLKDLIAASQLQLLQPDKGTDKSARTQSLMAMMMLQGMGKQDGNETDFFLDLTADGQTLVNGQDLSGLLGTKTKAKTIETAPAMPVQKVNSSNL